jgi:phospholipid-binding lipoprotein MlaA
VVDKAVLKPVARGYKAAVPPPVRSGVTNFFGNFNDVTTAVNDLLQWKLRDAFSDVGRIAINSTIGILGAFDVATPLGLQKHNEDFGQTFAVWGVKDGPYLVLPFLGPSNFRDTVGLGIQYFVDPEFFLVTHTPENYVVLGIRAVNLRANLLDAERILDVAAIDRYAFLREAYIQRRRSLIYDGNPPEEPGAVKTTPHRKTLKELEMEDELDDGTVAPPAPGSPTQK